MSSIHPQQIKESLSSPHEFQSKFGNQPQHLQNEEFGQETFHDISIKGWLFENTVFRGTIFKNDTLDGVTFRKCLFQFATVNSVVFRNCKFEDVEIQNGVWDSTQFIGGSIERLFTHGINDPLHEEWWEGLVFDGVAFRNNDMGKDGMLWRNTTFRNCHFEGNHLKSFQMQDGQSFDHCTFVRNKHAGVGGPVTNSHFEDNDYMEVYGDASNCVFKEPKGARVSGLAENIIADGMGLGGFSAKQYHNVKIQNAPDFLLLNYGDSLQSVGSSQQGESITMGNHYNKPIRHASVSGYKLRELSFEPTSTIENSTFENLEVEIMEVGDAHFKNCTFRNIKISKMLGYNKSETFENCTFENVILLPGAYTSGSWDPAKNADKPDSTIVIPWERN